uniref:Uncharacterized protein n=1 Tax=Phasianus colchicus TaxID=9054 RepID=A0A669PY25_PHACC
MYVCLYFSFIILVSSEELNTGNSEGMSDKVHWRKKEKHQPPFGYL